MAVEIAKKNIPAALAKLDKFIEKAEALDSSVIDAFESNSKELFEIIGPAAGDFVKRRAEIEDNLERLYNKKNKLCNELVEIKGMLEAIFNFEYNTISILEAV